MENEFHSKKIVVFDLDGTLSPSKTPMDAEMAELLGALTQTRLVAVMSGGSYEQFCAQFLPSLAKTKARLRNLFLFPACGTCFYCYDGAWMCVYEEALEEKERKQIHDAFFRAFSESGFSVPETLYGELIEDRGTQMTFSAFGQRAPLHLKEPWDPDGAKRQRIVAALKKHIPHFEVRIGGATSIDVTRKGVDKVYGIMRMEKHLGLAKADMLFVGDALFKGGNDEPVKKCGVDCVEVKNPNDTKRLIKNWL